MQQYFISKKVELHEHVVFDHEQSHHILNVMRMKQNDIIRVVDESHAIYLARIEIMKKQAGACLYECLEDHTQTAVEITLIQGMIKGEKWDFLLQKASELGASTIVPLTTKRSVVKTKEDKLDKKLERWNKICKEACEQCKRSTITEVKTPITLTSIETYKSSLNIVAYEDADFKIERLCDLLAANPSVTSITFVIGCEGGFDSEEITYLMSLGFQRVSLGARILRAETAAISIIDNTGFYYDMIGGKHG